MRRSLPFLFCLLGACAYGGTLTPELDSIIQAAPSDTAIWAIATTTLQSDLRSFASDPALSIKEKYDRKLAYLDQVAQLAQADLITYLQYVQAESVKAFSLVSRVAFVAAPQAIRAVAARADVDCVMGNFADSLPSALQTLPSDNPEWNISRVQADACWDAGVTGAGVVVGTIDTGIEDDHPAFHGRMRADNGWFDGVGGEPTPYDDNNHGTEVMGVLCGGDGRGPDPNDIGVAPGAAIIAAKGGDAQGWFYATAVLPCLDWMLHTGRPDVLNCSWGGHRTNTDYWNEFSNLREMGVIVVAAIGNSGPDANTSIRPGSFPAVIGVGATDRQDNVAWWSSRGPAPDLWPWNEESFWPRPDWCLINPALCAPGVDNANEEVGIRTAFRDLTYGYDFGTSFAAPHVAGCVALMRQVHPNLTTDEAFNVLTEFSDRPSQGGPFPNNNYGWGRLNCLAAVEETPSVPATVLRVLGTSDVPYATGPSQGRHIVRRPGTSVVHVTYQCGGSVYFTTSNDGGRHWSQPEGICPGTDPCISLDYQGTPWIAYRKNGSLYCAVKRASGDWGEWLIFDSSTFTIGPPSMVCSNCRGDAVPFPPPPPCDMAYVAFVAYPQTENGGVERWLYVAAFDTLHNFENSGRYHYFAQQVHKQGSSDEFDSMPCISRTFGDLLHVTWKIHNRATPDDQVVYITTSAPTSPAIIRGMGVPLISWTPLFPLRTDTRPGTDPSNDAYADRVMALWRAGLPPPFGIGVISERERVVNDPVWRRVFDWTDGQTEAGSPAFGRVAGVWRQQFNRGAEYGNLGGRFWGEEQPLRLTGTRTNQTWPQVDLQPASRRWEYDTARVVWTELRNGQYAVVFASYAHQNTRPDGYYRIACGQTTPSPYCTHRDGALAFDGYTLDYAVSNLGYRLSYLNPLCRYRIHATAYQRTAGPIQQRFRLGENGNPTWAETVATIPPSTPVDIWLDIPPCLYRDGAVNLTISKLQGQYAVLAHLAVFEYESISTGTGGGGQSAPTVHPRHEPSLNSAGLFSGHVTINYSLPSEARVSLRVFDLSGRAVRVLRDRRSAPVLAGSHSAEWDGCDDAGRMLSAGVYFSRLETESFNVGWRLVLTK